MWVEAVGLRPAGAAILNFKKASSRSDEGDVSLKMPCEEKQQETK